MYCCTQEEFKEIPEGSIFRVVTTKWHTVERGNPELTFVCKKGDGYADWAIYYGFADKGVSYICSNGLKLTQENSILSIFPCSDEVLKLYRK